MLKAARRSFVFFVSFVSFSLSAFWGIGLCSESNPLVIKTLVLPSRECNRMQPEIFHALTDAGRNLKDGAIVKFKFSVFNPYLAKSSLINDYISN
jgi:hypothetical protein